MKQAGKVIAAVFLLTCAGLAQDGRFQVSISGIATISKSSSGNQVVLTPTLGGGVLLAGQVRIAPKFSLQANFGHADNSQKYQTASLDYRLQSTLTEVSGALVFRPFSTENWKTFVFGGGGILVFNPNLTTVISPNLSNPSSPIETVQNIGAVRQTQPVVLYGGGVDHPLPIFKFVSVRLQYRGLFYNAPGFGVPVLFTGARGHIAEPSIGLVVNF